MSLEQASAILIIALFACFILWGRTAAGKAALIRVFGEPSPRNRARRQNAKRGTVASASRPSTAKTQSSPARRPHSGRGGKR